ncbi:hypothetical protein HGRIS_012044 [Hohenbuehelia grisea]|uniref:Oxidoreductase family protein n=1 Tax=Hohenbuehelia grisea TaxID=104357 RepID=A0ABR3IR30_9AGAR
MASRDAGLAILGAGIFAKEAHLPALAKLGSTVPVVKAVYSRSEKSAQDLSTAAAVTLHLDPPPSVYHDGDEASSLDALLARSDISAVLVILPITIQPSIVVKALAAGKHVLSEKPVAPDTVSGRKLINTYLSEYKPKGLIWRVAENWEAEPGYRAAAEVVHSGKIGKIVFFTARVINHIDKDSKWYKTPWRTVPDYQGGFLLDGGVHTAAALRTILPRGLTHLSGFASLNKDYLAPHDTIHTISKAGSHFHGTVEMTFASPTKSKAVADGITITGTDGWVSIAIVSPAAGSDAPVIRTTITTVERDEDSLKEIEKQEVTEEPMQGVAREIESFFAALAGKDDGLGLGDPENALQDVAFIEAALNSDGQVIDLQKLVDLEA